MRPPRFRSYQAGLRHAPLRAVGHKMYRISGLGRFPKFENLEQMAATPSKAIIADSLSMRRLSGEIEPEPKSAGRLPRRQIAPGSPYAALCRWLAVKLYVGEDVWL